MARAAHYGVADTQGAQSVYQVESHNGPLAGILRPPHSNVGAQGLLAPFSAVGRMAFTNYIMQSLVFGFVFFGYGLGLFGKMGAALVFLLGVVVYGLQAILSIAWLRRFRYGPIEWLWRTLMYRRMPPMLFKPIAN